MTDPPAAIGRFQIRSTLGQGGMGTLFLAWDPELERQVAIKVLNRDEEELRERFLREARSAARLRHRHIVTVFDVGEHDQQPFIAMEYIPGVTLASVIRARQALPIERKLELVEQLCDGLAFAHREGIVHRDVKPANLMIGSDGALKVLDFGVARMVQTAGLTQAGSLIGTLNYMSPEQVAGQTVDHRSDVFAVGAVLYELLACRQAFPGGLADGVLNKILHGQPEPLSAHVPGLDPEVAEIVSRAMAKEPGNRYQDLDAMRSDLQRARNRLVSAPAPASASDATAVRTQAGSRLRRPRRAMAGGALPGTAASGRRRAVVPWLLVAAATLLLLGLAGFLYLEREGATNPAPVGEGAADVPTGVPSEPVEGTSFEPSEAPVPPPPPPAPVEASAREEPETDGRPRTEPSGERAAATASMPAECARLLERASLGEPLTETEQTFLKRRCRG